MNNDIDIDKIFDQGRNIKPITEGLGFHHENKKDESMSLNTKKNILQKDLSKRNKVILSANKEPEFGKKATMGDLSAFYETPKAEKINPVIAPKAVVVKERVSLVERTLAFAIDLFVVSVIFISIIGLSLILSPLPQSILIRGFLDYNFVYDALILYTLLFIFYFSFMDKSSFSTLGKNLMEIKVITIDGRLSYFQTLMRSILIYIGLATLGLTSLLGINDILSKTELAKN